MDSDKNQNILEKQLKTLGQKVRIDILKKLKHSLTPLSFSKLQKEILGNDITSVNLSFHLNTLKKSQLIESSDDGYSITILGEQIIERILSIEQILNKQNRTLMIRTSKYSKEAFEINKIEEYLVKEGELEQHLARQIAHEVEERLSKTNIEYMTAPLMREYINAILLENGLEEVRHKLTRLGTPPFDAFKLFNSEDNEVTPKNFITRLGSDVSEQFLLLNLLPKNLADLYLSGKIALLYLNYWGLRPLSLYINSKTLINYLSKINSNFPKKIENTKDYIRLILKFLDFLQQLKQYYSEDLLLGDFNIQFGSFLDLPEISSTNFSFLTSQILQFNKIVNDGKSHLSIDFNYCGNSNKTPINQIQFNNNFLNSLNLEGNNHIRPLLNFKFSRGISSDINNEIIVNLLRIYDKNKLIFYHKNYPGLLNSSLIQIMKPEEDSIILDKILVNLHMISIEAKQNDHLFMDLLQNKMNEIFELFKIKEKLVKKKLNSIRHWDSITKHIYDSNINEIFDNAIKSVSFFGLNEAILNHCGIELDRTKSSENFGLKILLIMKKFIEERNLLNNSNFVLSQPHKDSYIRECWYDTMAQDKPKLNEYSTRIIRSNSNLPLDKKISLFKKFEKIINGGTLFNEKKPEDISFQEYIKILFQADINKFSLGDCIF